MVLSDRDIRAAIAKGRIVIEPFDDACVQPASLDIRLDDQFRVFRSSRHAYIDLAEPLDDITELVSVAGSRFILHPGEFVLGSTRERIRLPDDLVSRVEGKALALDTWMPTPAGWKQVGEISPGDLVFDDAGQPTRVRAVSPVMAGRPCREVVFSDGTKLVTDIDHQWVTTDKRGRWGRERRAAVVTTEEIARTLRLGRERNHQVALAGPVWYPQRDLVIDPYVLGVWLGDGTSTTVEVTCAEAGILEELAAAGYPAVRKPSRAITYRVGGAGHRRSTSTGRFEGNGSLSSKLRAMGLMGNKHIPDDYLHAAIEQRTALLQGLMDTDGYVDCLGRCGVTTVSERLAEQYYELVASLGFRPKLARKRAMSNGTDHGPAFEVQFTPDRPVFRLRRKRARQKVRGMFHRFRAIVDVREVQSVPVKCLEVASPNRLFLVTRAFIPTHNSSLGRLGLLIHSTAGFIDPAWDGHITLELSNVNTIPITLYPGMRIGQLSFFELSSPAERPYGSPELGSSYQGQSGPTPSRYRLDLPKA
ncbi:MAG: dCTP deaminase [Chloroflexi bacterium]|nr:dCTP deaminase [Chloroflexota bacterium]